METWWKTGYSDTKIETVEVVSSTAQRIVVRERWNGKDHDRRRDKRGQYDNYFPTWDEARDFLLERQRGKIRYAQEALQRARSAEGELMALKQP